MTLNDEKENWKHKRALLFKNATSHRTYKRGNQGPRELRQCSLCGQQLTQYRYLDSQYVTIVPHYLCKSSTLFNYSLCQHPDTCWKNYQRRFQNESNQ